MKPLVIVAVVLLVATFAIAIVARNQSIASMAKKAQEADLNKPPEKIFCLGHFDVEKGVSPLHPKQFGDIIWVAQENTHVKKGADLLILDDTLALIKVQEAEAAVAAAISQLAEANQLPAVYDIQAKGQMAMVESVEAEIKKTELDRTIQLGSLQDDPKRKKNAEDFYKFALQQLTKKKEGEQAKLDAIELQKKNTKQKIALAETDKKAKELLRDGAKEMLTHFKKTAPEDGTVLRVHVHKGETLGPNPRMYAIDFLPDAEIIVRAEVLQEWGRYVKPGAEVTVEDDTFNGPKWEGKVKSLSKWYAPTRSPVIEPFRYNDVRTLECIISVKDGGPEKRIGQRVRAVIKMQP